MLRGAGSILDKNDKKIIKIEIPLIGYGKKSKYRVCGACRDYIRSLSGPK